MAMAAKTHRSLLNRSKVRPRQRNRNRNDVALDDRYRREVALIVLQRSHCVHAVASKSTTKESGVLPEVPYAISATAKGTTVISASQRLLQLLLMSLTLTQPFLDQSEPTQSPSGQLRSSSTRSKSPLNSIPVRK